MLYFLCAPLCVPFVRVAVAACLLAASCAVAHAQAPVFTTVPSSRQVVTKGQNLVLSVAATGASSYQWKRNGRSIAGATTASLALNAAQPVRDNGWYHAYATNSSGTTRSATVFVTVVPASTQVFVWGFDPASQLSFVSGLTNVVEFSASRSASNSGVLLKADGTVASSSMTAPALSGVVAVAVGHYHYLALKSDGTLTTWGEYEYQQYNNYPTGISGVVAIAAGTYHNLALKADGTVTAWGNASGGGTAVPTDLTGVVEVTGGQGFSLALKADGTVVGWGSNGDGQSTIPAGLTGVIGITAGRFHSVALKADGTVVAWGLNTSGQCNVPAGLTGVVAIAAGLEHSLALKADGTVVAWGGSESTAMAVPAPLNSVFRLSGGAYLSAAIRDAGGDLAPTIVAQPQNVTAFTGQNVTLAVGVSAGTSVPSYQWRKGGVAISGATNSSLTLAEVTEANAGSYDVIVTAPLGSATSLPAVLTVSSTPALQLSSTGRQVVAFGSSFSLTASPALAAPLTYQWRRNGRPITGATQATFTAPSVTWQQAGAYQVVVSNSTGTALSDPVWLIVSRPSEVVGLGWNDKAQANVPPGLSDVVEVAAGGKHSLALRRDGTVVSWGDSASGQGSVPVGLASVVQVAAGKSHSMALRADGTVASWGTPNFSPVGLNRVIAIAAGSDYGLALKDNGTVVGWTSYGLASDVPAGLSAVSVAASSTFRMAVRPDGTVVVWSGAAPPGGLSNVVAISAAWDHALALKSDGTVVAWGGNFYGQCNVPVGLTSVVAIAGGDYFSCAVKSDGTVVKWGASYPDLPSSTAFAPVVGASATQHLLLLRDAATDTIPVISVHPVGGTLAIETTKTFSVTATGNRLSYQWRRNGVAIADATNASYPLGSLQGYHSGTYDVVVSNYLGSTTSNAATLFVGNAPLFSSYGHPESQSVGPGGTVTLRYSASATPAISSIQWRKNGVAIAGATSAELTLTNFQSGDAGSYTVALENALGVTVSNPAVLTLGSPNPPNIVSQPAGGTLSPGNVGSFQVSYTSYYLSVAIQWRKNGVPLPGATNALYVIGPVSLADSGIYDVVLTSVGGSVTSSPASLNVLSGSLGIATQPSAVSAYLGSSATWSVTASGTAPFTYQWRKAGVPIAGATDASFSIPAVQLSDAAAYSVVITNSFGTFTSNNAALTVLTASPTILISPAAVAVVPGATAQFTVTAVGGPLSYQWRKNSVALPGATGSSLVLTNVQAADAGSYSAVVSNLSGSATSLAGTLTVYSAPVISAHPANRSIDLGANGTLTVSATGNPSPSYQWRKDGVAISGKTSTVLTLSSVAQSAAGDYDVVVTNIAGSVTSNVATVTVLTYPPAITTQPVGATLGVGAGHQFTVVATGSPTLAYQWRRNGVALPWAIGSFLSVPDAQTYDTGDYDVVISNEFGSVTSTPVRLTVVPRPMTISARVVIGNGQDGALGVFTVEGPDAKKLLLRAVGPGITPFGLTQVVPDPQLEIFNQAGDLLATNDDWHEAANAAEIASATAAVGAFALAPGSPDSAVLRTFTPGSYTVRATGRDGVGGVAFLELHDADAVPNASRIPFVGVRGIVAPGEAIMVGGLNANGRGSRSFLLRAAGPALGLPLAVPNPSLRATRDGLVVGSNDDWETISFDVTPATSRVGAFPLPGGGRDAAIVLTGNLHAGSHTVQVGGAAVAGMVLLELHDLDSSRPFSLPPVIVSPPVAQTIAVGGSASLVVRANGSGPLAYQWRKDGANITGATSPTLSFAGAQLADGGLYSVAVTNVQGTAVSLPALFTVSSSAGGVTATHAVVGGGYRAGGTVTITNVLTYAGVPASLGWDVTPPAGWSYVSGTGEGDVKPLSGATSTLGWAWSSPPAGTVTFSYTLRAAATDVSLKTLSATAIVRAGETPQTVFAAPNPLTLVPLSATHSADSNQNFQIDLLELTRVIELYNTRNSTVRTGCYTVPVGITEDGFAPDASRLATQPVALPRYHSADTHGAGTGSPPDGRFDLLELTRVIELYNHRSGTVRTGQYRAQDGTEDGFAPGT